MCFSATASFAAGALLVPVGLYTLGEASRRDKRLLAIASFPFLFGIQQSIEGALWIALDAGDPPGVHTAALGFLFFAYFLWPALVPYAALRAEILPARARLFAILAATGFLFGASLYLPLLVQPGWLEVSLSRGSILYEPVLIYDAMIPRSVVRAFYAAIVALPLLLCSERAIRGFGALILISVIGSAAIYAHAFVSVWCFFAALLSLAVVVIVRSSAARSRAMT